MKKYSVNIKIEGDPMNYSIIGYEGQKKIEVVEHLNCFLKDRKLSLGKSNVILDQNGNEQGYCEFFSQEY